MDLEIAVDDPRADDVRALLSTHLSFSRASSPPEFSFALEVDELTEPGVTFFSARRRGALVGVAALKRLDEDHVELKSMHTREDERGQGVGRALVDHLLDHARREGYRRVSLETGTTDEFLAARTLYGRAGFAPCPPFGDYRASDFNTFMTILL
ncbi:MAG: GNAT family N-acetyltransferase [Acidobacteriota bacterium]|nr:GNAT family N-acetyltransferase [Acidobacteriota bacterium]